MSIISFISGNETPVGEQWVDDRVEEGQELLSSAVNQVKAWSADDPDTWTDDALRWVGGAIKSTGNWWQEATADQEGIGDDFLRAVGWTGGKAMKVLDAGSYYGGKLGGGIAEFIGVDARIGGFAGNVIGDVALGGAFTKVGQSAKTYNRIKKLRGLGVDDLQIQDLFTRRHAFAYGELADAPSDVKLALLTKKPQAGKKLLKNLTADVNVPSGATTRRVTLEMIPDAAAINVPRNVKGLEGAEDWIQGAYNHYRKNINESMPMKGYPNYKLNGKEFRATPGSKGKLTALDTAKKAASRKSRYVTEEGWLDELYTVLKEFNMEDKAEEFVSIIKKGNKVQADRRTRLNKALKSRGVIDLSEHFTIEHIGALKNNWPDVPENRWGLIKRKLNSRAGANMDPPDLNIRLSGTPKNMREWVIKQQLGVDDFTEDLPIKVRRAILAATKKVKGKKVADPEKIDEILDVYFKSIAK